MEKKSVLFFSRLELAFLYGSLHEYLKEYFNIVHVAYSSYEAEILRTRFGISELLIFKDLTKANAAITVSQEGLQIIDKLLIEQSNGRFNLNSMLQSNRSSKYIGYKNAIQAAAVYYKTWLDIFEREHIDFFVHEPVSLMMNQLAAAICKKQKGVYTTHILVQGDKNDYNFLMVDDYNGRPIEVNNLYTNLTVNSIASESERVSNYLEKFRNSYAVFFGALGNGAASFKLKASLGNAYLRSSLRRLIKPKKFDPVLDNIELFIEEDNLNQRRFKNFSKYKSIKYDKFDTSLPYYFYPLHLEPEAVVLYWADGLYANQVKLIENIAAQLPPGVFLYVKDHPHLYGYREKNDYDRIQNIPNVKLLTPSISGKQIIKDCKGVITLNGTGGFEALLMNKHVITFGSVFYGICKRVKRIENIKDLREQIYDLQQIVYGDDDELYRFVLAFLLCQKKGFTNFYGGMHKTLNINLESNAADVAMGLKDFFNNYSDFQIECNKN